tara:strand:- start:4 stop:105 length:102 start_codon:yes stop_codon:yes gene_type:complete
VSDFLKALEKAREEGKDKSLKELKEKAQTAKPK